MSATLTEEPPIRARIPADLDTPDQLVAGLTAHQILILAVAAVPLYATWHHLSDRVPLPVLTATTAALGAIAVTLALGRRDGLSLDTWLGAALTHRLRPRRLAPTPEQDPPARPRWAPSARAPERERRPGALRLPAETIGADGVITAGPGMSVVLVAASTVTAGLHTPGEQAVLLAGYARWLNSLTGGVQIVLSARRADLGARALHLAETAHRLAHPALAAAAIEHAEHLLDLCEDGDLLTRTVTIACTAGTEPAGIPRRARTARAGENGARGAGAGSGPEAARRAARTAAALSAVGSRCRVLDGAEASAVLSGALDPWGPCGPDWPRTPPGETVTAEPALIAGPENPQDREEARATGWVDNAPGWVDNAPGWVDNAPGWVDGAPRWVEPDVAGDRWSR